MSDVIAGQGIELLSQWYEYDGGPLVDLDATPTISATAVYGGTVALAATTSGVSHPGTGAYGYLWIPAADTAPGAHLIEWLGEQSGNPVVAQEIVTVGAPASAAAVNATSHGVWYTTRERVREACDVAETARSNGLIDEAIEAASREVELTLRRYFYPAVGTRFFDHSYDDGRGRLWLGSSELIYATAVVSGVGDGATLLDLYDLYLEPINSGPPYTRIEIADGAAATFSRGRRANAVTGLWGSCPLVETRAGSTAAAIVSTTATTITVTDSAAVGVGSIVKVDSERMLVTEKAMITTGQTGSLAASTGAVSLAVANGSAFAVGETLLIDSERVRVVDVAGNTLTVKRAWDGSTLAVHTTATIYAPRSCTVTRGALGTTAATHADAAPTYVFEPPGGVREYAAAEAIVTYFNKLAGYSRTIGSGENVRETAGRALKDVRSRALATLGRRQGPGAV